MEKPKFVEGRNLFILIIIGLVGLFGGIGLAWARMLYKFEIFGKDISSLGYIILGVAFFCALYLAGGLLYGRSPKQQ